MRFIVFCVSALLFANFAFAEIKPVLQIGHAPGPGVKFSAMGTDDYLVTSHSENKNEYKVWDKSTGKIAGVFKSKPFISKGNKRLFYTSDKGLTVKFLNSSKPDLSIKLPDYRRTVTVSDDGKYYGYLQVYRKAEDSNDMITYVFVKKVDDPSYENSLNIDGEFYDIELDMDRNRVFLKSIYGKDPAKMFSEKLKITCLDIVKRAYIHSVNFPEVNTTSITYDFENDRILTLLDNWNIVEVNASTGDINRRGQITAMNKKMIYTVDETLTILPMKNDKDKVIVQAPTDVFLADFEGKIYSHLISGKGAEPRGVSITKDSKYVYVVDRWGSLEKYEITTGKKVDEIKPLEFTWGTNLDFSADMKTLYGYGYALSLEDMTTTPTDSDKYNAVVTDNKSVHRYKASGSFDPADKTYASLEHFTKTKADGTLEDDTVYFVVRDKSTNKIIKQHPITTADVLKNEMHNDLLIITKIDIIYDYKNGYAIISSDKDINMILDIESGKKTNISKNSFKPVRNSQLLYQNSNKTKTITFFSVKNIETSLFTIASEYPRDIIKNSKGQLVVLKDREVSVYDGLTREVAGSFSFDFRATAVAYNSLFNVYAIASPYSSVAFYSPTGELKSDTLIIDDKTSITYTDEGYFSGTGEFYKHVHFVDENLNIYDYRQFASKFYRPEMVASIISGTGTTGETLSEVIASQPAPSVQLNKQICGTTTTEESIELSFNVSDNGGGIGDVIVYINGTMVSNDKRALKKSATQMSEKLALSSGDNIIEVIAYNKDNSLAGSPSRCSVNATFDAGKPTLHVFSIGIDQYENTELNLKYAGADADYFTSTLQSVSGKFFKEIKVTKLTGLEATSKKSVMEKIAQVATTVKADDYFIFYAASHGDIVKFDNKDSRYFLITSNIIFLDPENIQNDAISQEEIVDMVGNVPARNKIIIMDSCHSGQAGKQIQKMLFRGMSTKTAVELIRMASGSSVFTASQKTEQALEGYNGHGLFTYTLVEGLLGKADKDSDGHIMLSELKSYVERTVYKRSKEIYKAVQIPYINIGSLDIPIATTAN